MKYSYYSAMFMIDGWEIQTEDVIEWTKKGVHLEVYKGVLWDRKKVKKRKDQFERGKRRKFCGLHIIYIL